MLRCFIRRKRIQTFRTYSKSKSVAAPRNTFVIFESIRFFSLSRCKVAVLPQLYHPQTLKQGALSANSLDFPMAAIYVTMMSFLHSIFNRALSSVVEQLLYTEWVRGSIPRARTINKNSRTKLLMLLLMNNEEEIDRGGCCDFYSILCFSFLCNL
jgi:hypothetical protein